jgi:hypothetical protein
MDTNAGEFAQKMVEPVKGFVGAWIRNTAELVPLALQGGSNEAPVDGILSRMEEGIAGCMKDLWSQRLLKLPIGIQPSC